MVFKLRCNCDGGGETKVLELVVSRSSGEMQPRDHALSSSNGKRLSVPPISAIKLISFTLGLTGNNATDTAVAFGLREVRSHLYHLSRIMDRSLRMPRPTS